MSFHPDAVAKTVGEVFIIGTETGVLDDPAGRPVDGFAGRSRPDGFEGFGLGLADDLPYLSLLIRGLAEEDGPGDVRTIAFDGTSAVNEDCIVLLGCVRSEPREAVRPTGPPPPDTPFSGGRRSAAAGAGAHPSWLWKASR
jgi:hypothetical protein